MIDPRTIDAEQPTPKLTLAELQAEKARLKAQQAQTDLDAAEAASCTRADLLQAAGAIRAALLADIEGIAAELLEVIGQERDETRIHYRLSDHFHARLRAIGERAERATTALPTIGRHFARGIRPRELLTVSTWADKHRWLETGTNIPGPWRTDRTPYLREVMDSLSEHSTARTVCFMKSAGIGASESLWNWIGYTIAHLQNKDMLLVVPTLELRDRTFNPRLGKLIEESTAVREAVASTAKRSSTNRQDVLEFGARARLIKAGANSPDSMRAEHLPYVGCDEVDAFPWDVGGEGDPITLIDNRQRTFTRAKTYYVSTPTAEGQSRIAQLYERSDRRRYHVPCPHCGELHTLHFDRLKWDTDRTDDKQVTHAWMVCPHCGAVIEEGHKTAMLAAGRWIAERPEIKLHRGYHLNALYATVGLGLNWRQIAQKWVDCENDTAERRAFVNTYQGEVYREDGESVEAIALITRLETYQRHPDGRLALPISLTVAGIDVQGDRLEVSIYGYGPGEESWATGHHILAGDTTGAEVWEELDHTLAENGVQLACLDSGYNTSYVYAYAERRPWVIPIKGVTGAGRPLIEDDRKRRQRLRYRKKRGVPVEPLGVDQGKAILYARLKQERPQPGAPAPGYVHYPDQPDFDDEFFAQLTAERLVPKTRGHRVWHEWVQTRPRNEALDCAVYALAACRLAVAMPHLVRSAATIARDIAEPAPRAADPLAAPIAQPTAPVTRRVRGRRR